jgi:hypothetical protein
MRNLLALAAAVVLTVVVVGWYLGWYKVKTAPGTEGRREVTIDINGPKIGEDLSKGKEKLREMLDKKGPTSVASVPVPPPPTRGTAPPVAAQVLPPTQSVSVPAPPAPADQANWGLPSPQSFVAPSPTTQETVPLPPPPTR